MRALGGRLYSGALRSLFDGPPWMRFSIALLAIVAVYGMSVIIRKGWPYPVNRKGDCSFPRRRILHSSVPASRSSRLSLQRTAPTYCCKSGKREEVFETRALKVEERRGEGARKRKEAFGGNRTRDLVLTKDTLYRLSHEGRLYHYD